MAASTLRRCLLFGFIVFAGACATPQGLDRIDNLPMYGQPEIIRPAFAKEADEKFIQRAATGFGGREAASRAWFAEAERFMNQHNLDLAMRRYNQSWLLNPKNYQPYWGFGRVMFARGVNDKAIMYFEKSLQLVDDAYQKPALLADLATVHAAQAQKISPDKADERAQHARASDQLFAESTALDPKYALVWVQWAEALAYRGDIAGARQKLEHAESLQDASVGSDIERLKKKLSTSQLK